MKWAVVSRAASMAWRMDQRGPEGLWSRWEKREQYIQQIAKSYVKIISKEFLLREKTYFLIPSMQKVEFNN